MNELVLHSNGKEVRFVAEYKCEMSEERIFSDGDYIRTERKPYGFGTLDLYINDVKVASGSFHDFNTAKAAHVTADASSPMWFFCLGKGMKDLSIAEAYNTWINQVILDGTDEEVIEFNKQIEKENVAKEIAEAEKIIRKAESQNSIPTEEGYNKWRQRYIDFNLEGGGGYIPEVVTQEQLAIAKQIFKK
ncbi:MAG: hypothetical protein WCS21_10135 [Lachnospiraceae bacterium]